jgi:hypothetical protein
MRMTLPCVPFVRDGDIGATDKGVILAAVTDIINRPVSSLLERIACRDLQNLIDYASERTGVESEILVDNITIGDLLSIIRRSSSKNSLIHAVQFCRIFEIMCRYDYSYEIVVISNLGAYLEALSEASLYETAANTVAEFLSMAETVKEEADKIPLFEYLSILDKYANRHWDIEEETVEEYANDIQDLYRHYKKLLVEAPCMIIKSNMTDIRRKCALTGDDNRNY